jgi:hypothetical protein
VPKPLLVGQTVKATTTFKTEAGTVFDPHSVVFNIADPTGKVTAYSAPQHVSTGVYAEEFVLTTGGTWWFRNEGLDETGAVVAVDQAPFEVESERPFTS